MKRYICLLICVVIGFVLLLGFRKGHNSKKIEPTRHETVNDFTDVRMITKEGTVSPSGLTVVFENNSDKDCIYGEFFLLEEKINNRWYQLPVVIDNDYAFHDIGYNLAPGESKEFEIDWEWLYGSLDVGDYRIIKEVLDFRGTGDYDRYYLTAEFLIK